MAGRLERQPRTAQLKLLTKRVGPKFFANPIHLIPEGPARLNDFKFNPESIINLPATINPLNLTIINTVDRPRNYTLGALQSHDNEAWREAVHEFSGLVFATARYYTQDEEQAADIMQEAFLRAFRYIKTFDGRASFKTWLLRIAINLTKDYTRWKRVRRNEELTDFRDYPNIVSETRSLQPEEVTLSAEVKEVLDNALGSLPSSLRKIITLCYIQESTHEEASKQLGIPIGTVKSRLSRARAALRNMEEVQRLR